MGMNEGNIKRCMIGGKQVKVDGRDLDEVKAKSRPGTKHPRKRMRIKVLSAFQSPG
jgi:hypothetical protein